MRTTLLLVAAFAALCTGTGAAPLFNVRRPDESTWKRTACGSPSGDADIPSQWAAEVNASSTPLPAFPRPQAVRVSEMPDAMASSGAAFATLRDTGDPAVWQNLNGLWEWEATNDDGSKPPFGKQLNSSILVPFPVESCLSGVAPSSSAEAEDRMRMWYRLEFTPNMSSVAGVKERTLLHFGAVDWQSQVYVNSKLVANHTGGFDGFTADITNALQADKNELIVYVYDPSDHGAQPNGKQRISAIDNPGGDTYTPSSGIWQTVWLETVPASAYISEIKIDQHSTTEVGVYVTVETQLKEGVTVKATVLGPDVTATGDAGARLDITLPSPAHLWSDKDPFLYPLQITVSVAGEQVDSVASYFGLRTFELQANATNGTMRPLLNNDFTFLAGFLDQSWWPDGQYTAPTDEALQYDIAAVKMFGLNMIRLHQKVNPERWYYHADKLGVIVFQDMVQKYGGASAETIPYFVDDLKAMIKGRGNHPSIVQFTAFNEGDCWSVFKDKPFDVAGIVQLIKELDPTRLVDTDSGGGANNMHIGDVNDVHDYPNPGNPAPSKTQYAMIGEFGGIGAFVPGKEWKPNACHTYLKVDTPTDEADAYIKMAATIQSQVDHVSASVYTQTTDVELECDGFLNYDRTNKFSDADTARIKAANEAIINAS